MTSEQPTVWDMREDELYTFTGAAEPTPFFRTDGRGGWEPWDWCVRDDGPKREETICQQIRELLMADDD